MKKFFSRKGLSLRVKLAAGFLLLAIILAVVGIIGQFILGRSIEQLDSMVETSIIGNTIIEELDNVINTTDKYLTDRNDDQKNAVNETLKRIDEDIAKLSGWTTDPESIAILDSIKSMLDKISSNVHKILSAQEGEPSSQYTGMVSENSRTGLFLRTSINDFVSNELKIQKILREDISFRANIAKKIVLVLFIFISAAGAVIGSLYISRVTRMVRRIAEGARQIAEGDLTLQTIQVKSNDDLRILAGAFNDMQTNLRVIMEKIRSTAGNVASSADALKSVSEQNAKAVEQIADSIQQVAAGATDQSEKVETSGAVVKELAEHISIMTASTQTALASSELANDAAKAGFEKVSSLISQIDDIKEKLMMTNISATELKNKTSKIGSITEAISAIADQTNLLALNAAIEAARAGEHGSGFAVVAEEIRKLAEASRQATGEIAKMLNEIGAQSDNVSELMENGLTAVNYSTESARESGEAFNAIVSTSKDSTGSISTVADGIRQIESQISRVSELSLEIDGISKRTMAGTSEIAAVIEEQTANQQEVLSSVSLLSELSAELKDMIGAFKTENHQ